VTWSPHLRAIPGWTQVALARNLPMVEQIDGQVLALFPAALRQLTHHSVMMKAVPLQKPRWLCFQ